MKLKLMKHIVFLLFNIGLFVFFSNQQIQAQTLISGHIIDNLNKNAIPDAQVSFPNRNLKTTTNNQGYFSIYVNIDDTNQQDDFDFRAIYNKIYWSSRKPINLRIYNSLGQEVIPVVRTEKGNGEIDLENYATGVYFLVVNCDGSSFTYKFGKSPYSINLLNKNNAKAIVSRVNTLKTTAFEDTLMITKNGYYPQKYYYQESGGTYEILKTHYDNEIDYLDKIIRPEAYVLLQGLPLNPTFGEVKSIKIVYSIPDGKIYYTNSQKFAIHYDFCAQVLGYSKGHAIFNQEQYAKNPNRIYILATINHFISSDIYTIEFFAGDELDCQDFKTVYDKVTSTFLPGNKLWFYANSTERAKCTALPVISSDELYKGQNYQPLNAEENYGYLRKISVNDLEKTYLSRHDIVLLDGIPLDISVVAGIITTEFQTPLSHINVLSHNRGTPNMALRNGWTNPLLTNLLDKLVYLKVSLDSFQIREASLQEAQAFWAQKEPQTPHVLNIDTTTSGLIELQSAGISSVSCIGGKAANFAELTKVNVTNYGPLPLPEGYFAIPFYYYHQHMKKYGLDIFVNNMLNSEEFKTNIAFRQSQLKKLQDSIKKSPLDTALIRIVKEKISSQGSYTTFRFRSSTNAEDIEGFNGAGLYDSYTGSLTDPDKPVDKAIKKTWASLWNFSAFEEREYFKIDHRTVAMGILAHRSYPAEAANGVVITENLYNPYNPAITINVQIGEISVVSPDENYLPDQIIYYTYSDEDIIEYVNHSNVPGMEGKTVMTDGELKVLKNCCMAIYYHYCRLNFECNTMDIEFKVDIVNGNRKVYIKQARLY